MAWINRTLCEALEEMRACVKTGNYSYLPGLIEEAQSMGRRMEASLEDTNDLESTARQRKASMKEQEKLEREIEALQQKKAELSK